MKDIIVAVEQNIDITLPSGDLINNIFVFLLKDQWIKCKSEWTSSIGALKGWIV